MGKREKEGQTCLFGGGECPFFVEKNREGLSDAAGDDGDTVCVFHHWPGGRDLSAKDSGGAGTKEGGAFRNHAGARGHGAYFVPFYGAFVHGEYGEIHDAEQYTLLVYEAVVYGFSFLRV